MKKPIYVISIGFKMQLCMCVSGVNVEGEKKRPQKMTRKSEASKMTLLVVQGRIWHCPGAENIPPFPICQDR